MARDNIVAAGMLFVITGVWSAIYLPKLTPIFDNSQMPMIAIMVILISGIIYTTYAGVMG